MAVARVEAVLKALGVKHDAKPRGGRIWGRCPYHEDEHPSWCIRIEPPRYGYHYCNGCKAGGGLHGLVMHVLGIDADEAEGWLQKMPALPAVPTEPVPDVIRVEVSSSAPAFVLPSEVIFRSLEEWVSPARYYAQKRGLTSAQVERWGLGYAVEGRLNGRIVVPIWAKGRRPASFMARDFTEDPTRRRYLYPSNVEHPDHVVMFGELYWPSVPNRDVIVLTEGALDAMAFERVADVFIGALGGSDVKPSHLARLSSFRAVLGFTDNDQAGEAAWATLEAALWRHTMLVRGRMPKGEDANSLSPEARREFLCEALRKL